MRLDIRLPIGLMFTLLGTLLAVFGLIGDKSVFQRSLGINVDLWWGLVMLGFGVVMFVLGRRGPRRRGRLKKVPKERISTRLNLTLVSKSER